MTLQGDINKLNFDNSFLEFTAQIVGADYFYRDGKKIVGVSLYKHDSNLQNLPDINLQIIFDGEDIPFGLAMASEIGKTAILFFANANFDIKQIRVEDSKPAH